MSDDETYDFLENACGIIVAILVFCAIYSEVGTTKTSPHGDEIKEDFVVASEGH